MFKPSPATALSQPVNEHITRLPTCYRGAALAWQRATLPALHLCDLATSSSGDSIELLTVILADLIATSEFLRPSPGLLMLVPRRKQESYTASHQHVPDAVGVVIVLIGFHECIY